MGFLPSPRADHQYGAWPVPRAHEHMVGTGGAVEEVPLPQPSLLAIENYEALTVEDEKVLLHGLRVIPAIRLAGLHDLDIHAGVRPAAVLRLEADNCCATRVTERRGVGQIHDQDLIHGPTILVAKRRD